MKAVAVADVTIEGSEDEASAIVGVCAASCATFPVTPPSPATVASSTRLDRERCRHSLHPTLLLHHMRTWLINSLRMTCITRRFPTYGFQHKANSHAMPHVDGLHVV
nr:hypothetical protein Iba_chr09dCG10310 [Ipomoea batatas]